MKRYIIYLSVLCLLFASCRSSKQEQSSGQTDLKRQVEQEIARNKQLEKENKQKKNAKAKEDKKKQREEAKLIEQASKDERRRIEQELKKEKEELVNSLKNQNALTNQQEESLKEEEALLQQEIETKDSVAIDNELLALLSQSENFQQDSSLSSNSDSASAVVKEEEKPMSDMEKVIALAQGKDLNEKKPAATQRQSVDITKMTEKEKKDLLKQLKKEERKKNGSFIKRQWQEAFPEHVDRDIPYNNWYKELPRSIMILWPWNRSSYSHADEMLYVSAAKELSSKGYYVPPVLSTIDQHKQDTVFSSQYIKVNDLPSISKQYGADAVMFVTIYRFDNPYWSSSTKASVHYTLVSAKTMDTLFMRQIEFDYDTPLPPKTNKDRELDLDEQQRHDLGVMQQIQTYAFTDIPYGPYHKKYNTDRKKFSRKQQVKHKINVRPS